ncbi:MAG: two-component sensor histidine kinase [Planctomycetes bacterium]|nr:two-component sensor histidine kinase [Planctomycetota bacterium]
MKWLALVVGGLLSGPVWLWIAKWWMRRTIERTRQIAASARRQEHLVELGALTGGLAHEIKNPLSTIKVNLRLLTEDLDSPSASEQQKRWLRRLVSVEAEVSRLQETLEDFLRYAGRMELQRRIVDIRDVLTGLVDFFAPQAHAGGVRVRTHVSDEPLTAEIDVDLFKQALLNLMINAQQAMTEGGDLICRAERVGRMIQIEVIDTGPGMDEATVASIFRAYFSTKRGGTGLGLPTAHRIVKAHEGQITVDTAPGKGTRFVIRIPRLETAGAD